MNDFLTDIRFSQSFPWWIAGPFFIVASGLIIFSYYRSDKPLSRRNRAILIALRVTSVALLLFLLLEPTLISKVAVRRKANLLFLVDGSQSMSLTDVGENASRVSAVKEKLLPVDKSALSDLADKFDMRFYQFDSECSYVDELSLKAEGALTDIGKAISKAVDEWKGQPIAGIVLVTDGANNSGSDPVKISSQTSIPVHAIGVGSPQMPRDIQIARIEASPIAYVDHILPVRVAIKNSGYDGTSTRISLMQENRLVDSLSITLDSQNGEQIAELRLKPQQEGTFKFKVSVPPVQDEITVQNNEYQFFVRVVKTKLKVIYIDGRPRWEYTFLSRALKKDPNIEPTFLIANKDGSYYRTSSLKSFPNSRNELFSYDVIIMGDIRPDFFKSEQLSLIKEFVENKGGALVFLGGKYSLGKGGFGESVLKEILPVEISRNGARQINDAFNPVLTQYGLIHPITRLSDDQVENIAMWRDFPALTRFYEFASIRSGATVLAEHQRERGKPFIAFQRYGKGVSLVIASDTLWRWSFGTYAFGGDDSNYRKFWSVTIRWLASVNTAADMVNLETDKQSYYRDEKVKITAYIYNESYDPVNDALIKADVQTPSGTTLDLTFISDGNGRYSAEFIPTGDGRYSVTVEARYAGKLLGKSSTEFLVQTATLEFRDTQLNESLLKSIASASNGSYRHLRDISSLPGSIKEIDDTVISVRERGIWDNGFMLMLAVALLGAEWILRKRKGLI